MSAPDQKPEVQHIHLDYDQAAAVALAALLAMSQSFASTAETKALGTTFEEALRDGSPGALGAALGLLIAHAAAFEASLAPSDPRKILPLFRELRNEGRVKQGLRPFVESAQVGEA